MEILEKFSHWKAAIWTYPSTGSKRIIHEKYFQMLKTWQSSLFQDKSIWKTMVWGSGNFLVSFFFPTQSIIRQLVSSCENLHSHMLTFSHTNNQFTYKNLFSVAHKFLCKQYFLEKIPPQMTPIPMTAVSKHCRQCEYVFIYFK